MLDKHDTSLRAAVLLSAALLTGFCGYSPALAQSSTERQATLATRIADYEQAIAGLDGSYTPASAEVFQAQQASLPGMVSFDVTERGEIINIDVQGAPETMNRENIGAIAMRLDQSVYRPRLVDGRPVIARLIVAASEL